MRGVLVIPFLAMLAGLLILQPPISLYTVLTGSMEPYVPRGSLVLVEGVPPGLGEVGVYRLEAGGKAYSIVHRVIGVEDGFYIFKGDATEAVERVPSADVIGRVVLAVPYVGYLYMAGLANPMLVLLFLLVLFIPPRNLSLFPLSFITGLFSFVSPHRWLASAVSPAIWLMLSSCASITAYLIERNEGPHWLIYISYIMLSVANMFGTDARGVLSWVGHG